MSNHLSLCIPLTPPLKCTPQVVPNQDDVMGKFSTVPHSALQYPDWEEPRVSDVLFCDTEDYFAPNPLNEWYKNQIQKITDSPLTHAMTIVDIVTLGNGEKEYLIIHAEFGPNAYLDVLLDNEKGKYKNGYKGKVVRYTGKNKKLFRQLVAHYLYSYIRETHNKEIYSVPQATLSTLPKVTSIARALHLFSHKGINGKPMDKPGWGGKRVLPSTLRSLLSLSLDPLLFAFTYRNPTFWTLLFAIVSHYTYPIALDLLEPDGMHCAKLIAQAIEGAFKTINHDTNPQERYLPVYSDACTTIDLFNALSQKNASSEQQNFEVLGDWKCVRKEALTSIKKDFLIAKSRLQMEEQFQSTIKTDPTPVYPQTPSLFGKIFSFFPFPSKDTIEGAVNAACDELLEMRV